jgi:hypothetical protein
MAWAPMAAELWAHPTALLTVVGEALLPAEARTDEEGHPAAGWPV